MRLVAHDLEFLQLPPVHLSTTPVVTLDVQGRELARVTLQLLLERVDVVQVDVRVAHGVDQFAGDEVARVGEHVRQKGVTCNVERHAQTHVARSLVQDARQVSFCLCLLWTVFCRGSRRLCLTLLLRRRGKSLFASRGVRVTHVELSKHVARREGHEFQVGHVPGAEDDAAVVRVGLEFAHDLGDLIDTLVRVVRVAIFVRGAEVAPLETVDGTQIPFFAVRESQII